MLAAGLVLTGCTVGPKVDTVPYTPAPTITPNSNEAVVYIMRSWRGNAAAVNYPIYEDGVEIGALSNNSFTIHRTGAEKPFYCSDVAEFGTYMELQPGKIYYLDSWLSPGDLWGGKGGLRFQQIPETLAKEKLPKMEYAMPAK